MPAVRWLVMSSVAAVLTAFAAFPADAAPVGGYAALGDSYSSGLGAGTTYTGGGCERSSGAFSALWSAAHPAVPYTSLACSGARTSDVAVQAAQIASTTSLVSVTTGGNDVGFSSIMTTCALQGTSACVSAVNAAEYAARYTLPGQLDAAYNAIATHAPSAKVVVLGYPDFYQLNVFLCIGLSSTSRAKIDEGIDVVDTALSLAAARHTFTFADVRSAFHGHELCSGSKWLHSVDLLDLQESYHPTASGQRYGYLPAFTAAAA